MGATWWSLTKRRRKVLAHGHPSRLPSVRPPLVPSHLRRSRLHTVAKLGSSDFTRMTISRDYKTPVIRTAVAQGVVLVLSGMVLDGGYFLYTSLIAAAAYWAALLIIIARHPASPAKGHLIWARAGFAVALALAFAICPLVLFLRSQL